MFTKRKRIRAFGLAVRVVAGMGILLPLIFASPAAAAPLEDAAAAAVEKATASLEQAIKSHPERFEGLERVAVIPFRGDDDKRLSDLVQIRLTRTDFKVMLRDEVDRIFAEQKFTLDYTDLFNNKKDTVAQLGNLLGVQAYLFGDVIRAGSTPDGGAEVRLNLQLVDVNTAQVLWGEAVEGRVVPAPAPLDPKRFMWPLLLAVAALVVLVTLGFAFAGGRRTAREKLDRNQAATTQRRTERARRTQMQKEILKAMEVVRNVGRLCAALPVERADLAERMRRVSEGFDQLQREIDTAPASGASDSSNELHEWQEVFDRQLRELTLGLQDMNQQVQSGQTADLDGQIASLEDRAGRLNAKWLDRQGVIARLT